MQRTQTADQHEHAILTHQLRVIGPYRLEKIIGEGGMGAVYLAQQTEPVQRQVAIKVTRVDLASVGRLARFESERQILATLKHPNIAQVFDAGQTAEGFPFMVMEYVNGPSIDVYAAQQMCSVLDRIRLIVQASKALAHAHQNGVIHRDVKPANLIVEQIDGKACVKLIDFGIAKLVENQTAGQTKTGHSLGTPEYMSPEQQKALSDIDTRTDVYSLGLTLFELLTGTLPFLSKPGWATMDNASFMVPSRFVANSDGDALAQHGAGERTPAQLSAKLRGELDWVVMKACAPDREQRYSSVREFAADLERYLANEPVLAAPPKQWYVLKKFMMRNRWQSIAVGATLLLSAVAAALVFNAWQQEKKARALADQQLKQHQAFNDFIVRVLTTVKPNAQGQPILLTDVIQRAHTEVEQHFKNDRVSAAAMRMLLARVDFVMQQKRPGPPAPEAQTQAPK
jgi:eukaryotic-like serine/threonine-protein kinase